MLTNPNPDKPSEKPVWGLVGSGKSVSVTAVRKLREENHLAPVADGLFGADLSQTFQWVETP